MSYISLHNHTSMGSLLDGFGTTEDYCKHAAELGMTHIGISNHGTVDDFISFQNSCKKYNLTPIFGTEFYMVPDIKIKEKGEKRDHILVFVKNGIGFQNLLKMVTISNLEGFFYRPRIDSKILIENSEGLIITSGCSASPLRKGYGRELFEELIDKQKEDIFLEIMPHTHDEQYEVNKLCYELSDKWDIPLIATNDCHYVHKDDSKAHEVLLAVGTNKKWNDPNRWSFNGKDFYLRSERDMRQAFVNQDQFDRDIFVDAIKNTFLIAERCSEFTKIESKKITLPKVKSVEGDDYEYLEKLCYEKLENSEFANDRVYIERLKEELKLIKEKGFERYFLLVWDIMKWCREVDIMPGPARGSSAGSLVCYLTGITQVDPIKHKLLFSRFLSPDRIDLPDADIDIEDIKRPLIRKYLEETYGKWNVAGISTFSILRGRGAVRDVSRVFEVPLKDVNKACSVIQSKIGESDEEESSIKDAFDNFEDGKEFKEKYPDVADLSIQLEGQYRNRGVHAAALVVSENDLRSGSRCALTLDKNKEIVTNWDKNTIEHFGLVKLDMLGLKMLSALKECQKLIKENHGVDIDYTKIPLEDPKYYEELSKGNAIGCFQLGSSNIRKFCRQLGLENFDHLVAATALYRPGPLGAGFADSFIKRKNGEEPITYIHPVVEEVTKNTYGVIVYQEQVMSILHLLSGMDWATVDKIRKLMAKSKGRDSLKKYEEDFVEGCKEKRTLNEEQAFMLFEELMNFGLYGFNKCLTGDTILYKSSANKISGNEITIKQLFDSWNSKTSVGAKYRGKTGLQIQQLHSDGIIRYGKIKGVWSNGIRKVYEIKTESKKSIRATENHKFLIGDNYKTVSDTKVGEMIAIRGQRASDYSAKKNGSSIPKYRGKGETYVGAGFKKGVKNVGFVDGRSSCFEQSKKIVIERSSGKCEFCDKNIYLKNELKEITKIGKPELAHINSFDFLGGDFNKFHSPENIMFLCNSCHKKLDYQKGERKKRGSRGFIKNYEKIISIEYCGEEEVFDIEMESPNHNFIANGFVSHNSHSVSYSYITIWNMYLKIYYPYEFICSLLSYGTDDDDKKDEYIEEAFRLGLDVRPPKIGISKSYEWVIKDSVLYAPFIEIKGVGDKTAKGFEQIKLKNEGFYTKETSPVSTRFLNILDKINAYEDKPLSDEESDNVSDFLGISLVKNKLYKYKKLIKLINSSLKLSEVKKININQTTEEFGYYFGTITELNLSTRTGKSGQYNVANASFKDMSGDCKISFDSEFYKSNVFEIEHCEDKIIIIKANSPRKAGSLVVVDAWFQDQILSGDLGSLFLGLCENTRFCNSEVAKCELCEFSKDCKSPVLPRQGRNNVMIINETTVSAEAERVMWRELKKNGFVERDFHVTNFIKCEVKDLKKITKKHVNECSVWLEEEIENLKPFIVLSFGNTGLKFFKDEDSGIMTKNGTTEWDERYGFWVCYCNSPSTTFYGPQNVKDFKAGIGNFSQKVKDLGLVAF